MILIDEVTIGIMLQQEPIQVKPIIENLAALDMATDAPEVRVSLGFEILVADKGRVKTLHLESRMVRRADRLRPHWPDDEEGVVL